MAKIKLSALVSDVSGKLNGSVFQRSKGGLSLRTNPKKKVELSARQQLTFGINTRYRKSGGYPGSFILTQFEKESMRHTLHSEFISSYYMPAGAYFGKRGVESLAYGGTLLLPQPAGEPPVTVHLDYQPTYYAPLRYLNFNYVPEFSYNHDWRLVVDLQLSRGYTGGWSPDKWKHLGWFTPTPPSQTFIVQNGFFPDYDIAHKRMYSRIRMLYPNTGRWTNSVISEVRKT